jgi:hypothetical protein
LLFLLIYIVYNQQLMSEKEQLSCSFGVQTATTRAVFGRRDIRRTLPDRSGFDPG